LLQLSAKGGGMSIRSYAKIRAVETPEIFSEILTKPNICEEKIDGSQVSWGVYNGKLQVKSRTVLLDLENPGMFTKAVASIKERQDKLIDGYTYRGEFLAKEKHNVLCYSRVPKGNIVIFDIEDEEGIPVNYKLKTIAAEFLELDVTPKLDWDVTSIKELEKLLNKDSILGGCKIEGVVVKNYEKKDRHGHYLMGKYVSTAFRELKSSKQKIGSNSIIELADSLKGNDNARWLKALQHLKEKEELISDAKDIGTIIKEVIRDTEEECSDLIKEKLYSIYIKDIKRELTRGLPEWYKNKLIEDNKPISTQVDIVIGDTVVIRETCLTYNIGKKARVKGISYSCLTKESTTLHLEVEGGGYCFIPINNVDKIESKTIEMVKPEDCEWP
jgi:hypothetical protein